MSYTQDYVAGFVKTAADFGLPAEDLLVLTGIEKTAWSEQWWSETGKPAIKALSGFVKSIPDKLRELNETRKILAEGIKAVPGETMADRARNLVSGTKAVAGLGDLINGAKAGIGNITNRLSGFWNGLNPNTRRALITSLAVGSIPMLFGSGSFGRRLTNSLAAGAAGGLGMYGLSRLGAYDKVKDNAILAKQYLTDRVKSLESTSAAPAAAAGAQD